MFDHGPVLETNDLLLNTLQLKEIMLPLNKLDSLILGGFEFFKVSLNDFHKLALL